MKNLLMISVDDLFTYQKFRTKFGVTIETPNFDRLAAMGTSFDAAYATTPLCAPSRATVLTGKSLFETQIFNNFDP
jgi:arylsulfatase A-like enzyme